MLVVAKNRAPGNVQRITVGISIPEQQSHFKASRGIVGLRTPDLLLITLHATITDPDKAKNAGGKVGRLTAV